MNYVDISYETVMDYWQISVEDAYDDDCFRVSAQKAQAALDEGEVAFVKFVFEHIGDTGFNILSAAYDNETPVTLDEKDLTHTQLAEALGKTAPSP